MNKPEVKIVKKEEFEEIKDDVEHLDNKVEALDSDLQQFKKDIASREKQLRLDLASKLPYGILWVAFVLFGGVGAGYLLNDFVFKAVTWWSYIIGIGGTAVIATAYWLYKRSKVG